MSLIENRRNILAYYFSFVIDTIALAVEDGTENIVAGTEELEKITVYQQKKRKVFIILVIAIILGLIVVISLVSSFKK